jgi:ribosome biogenesis protein Nip4
METTFSKQVNCVCVRVISCTMIMKIHETTFLSFAGLGRITDNTPQYQGVIVYTMSDIPIGFGATARSTTDARRLDPTEIVVFHQADAGEYLRSENEMF